LENKYKKFKMIFKKIKKKIPKKWREFVRGKLKCLYPQMKCEIWCLDSVEMGENFVKIQGWALALKKDHSQYSFLINNKSFDTVNYPIPRDDIAKLYWYIPDAVNSGFTCQAAIKPENLFPDGFATISYIDQKTRIPLRNEHNYYCFDINKEKDLPLPEKKSRARVQGIDSKIIFRLEGFTNFMKLKLILNKTLGRDFDDFSNILDWGCGCGRTTRYFSTVRNTSITGVDIDPKNIEWCHKHLPFAHFLKIPKYPPSSIPDSSFDLIFGISVFTHLREKVQFEWLKELHRIARNDAILMMSTHGEDAAKRSVLGPEYFFPLKLKGFLDVGFNTELDDIIEGDDYYRDIYHLQRYIKTRWSRYFEIIDIIPGTIGNLQDLVVMKKKNRS